MFAEARVPAFCGALLTGVVGFAAHTSAQDAPAPATEEYVHFDTVKARVQVQMDGTQETTIQVGVLLRTSAAVTEFGQIGLPYVDGLGDVSFADVAVQKPDGRRVELEGPRPRGHQSVRREQPSDSRRRPAAQGDRSGVSSPVTGSPTASCCASAPSPRTASSERWSSTC